MPNKHSWSRPVNLIYPLENRIASDEPEDVPPEKPVDVSEQVETDVSKPPPDGPDEPPESEETERPKRKDRKTGALRLHVMTTRAMAKTTAIVTTIMGIFLFAHLSQGCSLHCEMEGISVETVSTADILLCCEQDQCHFESNATGGIRTLPESLTHPGYHCNLVCHYKEGHQSPKEIYCPSRSPPRHLSSSWIATLTITGVLLVIAGYLAGWKTEPLRRWISQRRRSQGQLADRPAPDLGNRPQPDAQGFYQISLDSPALSVPTTKESSGKEKWLEACRWTCTAPRPRKRRPGTIQSAIQSGNLHTQ
jgi:hypothetical protein